MPEQNKRTAWVVDDESFWITLVTEYVKPAQVEVTRTFPSAEAASNALKEGKDLPDIVFTDNDTGGEIKGVELACELEAKGIACAVLSSGKNVDKILAAIGCKSSIYIYKASSDIPDQVRDFIDKVTKSSPGSFVEGSNLSPVGADHIKYF